MATWEQFKARINTYINKIFDSDFIGNTIQVLLYGLIFMLPFLIYLNISLIKSYVYGLMLYFLWKEIIGDVGDAISKGKHNGG